MKDLIKRVKGYLQEFWEEKFNFSGYTSRKDYWLTILILYILLNVFTIIYSIIVAIIDAILPYPISDGIMIALLIIFGVMVFIIIIGIIAMQVRRCRVAGMSGGFYFLCILFSWLGTGIIIFIYTLMDDKNMPIPPNLTGLENIVNRDN